MVGAALVLSGEAKVDELDIFVLVEEDVFEFEVAVNAVLQVDIGYSADKLSEDSLDFDDIEGCVSEEIVVELIAC